MEKLKKGRPKKGRPNQKQVSNEDRLVLGTLYEEGVSVKDLMAKYNISKNSLYSILREPEVLQVRNAYKQASIDRLWIAFERNATKIDEVMDKYISEATLEQRIKRTDLPGLFKVFNSIINNKVKLKELALKEQEVELKQKLIDANPEPDKGMIQDLLLVLENNNSLKRVKYTGDNMEEKKDLDSEDIDEDIKKRSKILNKGKSNG